LLRLSPAAAGELLGASPLQKSCLLRQLVAASNTHKVEHDTRLDHQLPFAAAFLLVNRKLLKAPQQLLSDYSVSGVT